MKLTFKIWILLILVFFSLVAIFGIPPKAIQSGVLITDVEKSSSVFEQGLRAGDILISVNGNSIKNLEDYSQIVSEYPKLNEERITFLTQNKKEIIVFEKEFPPISISKIPQTNIELGLDLAGGSRALIKAENKSLTSEEASDLATITANRLNAFGLTDLFVTSVSDLSGNNFMLIEIAGATPKDLRNLISEQGEFEARIGNKTVFTGGERDIASVGRDAQNARIESCDQSSDGTYYCTFSFTITLSPEAAKKHADITSNLGVNMTSQGNYLSEKLDLILDGNLVDSLLISEGLKGQLTTQISISGSGTGQTYDDALNSAKENMKKLQTILMTGSLPYKLEIVKLDTISPTLGKEIIKTIIFTALGIILIVALTLFFRYKSFKSSLALVATTISEVIIILGVAAMIRWNIDLPGIAGILATLGTGVDDLIILLDESNQKVILSLKQRLKRGFVIIMGAYFTTFASLLPLIWAGAGLLKGFAITTMIGISVGVFITRPAFSDMIKGLKKE